MLAQGYIFWQSQTNKIIISFLSHYDTFQVFTFTTIMTCPVMTRRSQLILSLSIWRAVLLCFEFLFRVMDFWNCWKLVFVIFHCVMIQKYYKKFILISYISSLRLHVHVYVLNAFQNKSHFEKNNLDSCPLKSLIMRQLRTLLWSWVN